MITELRNFVDKISSTTIARIILFNLFLQLMLCGATLIVALYSSLRFVAYRFVEGTKFSKNFLDLKLLKYELLTSSIATLGCGCILFILCSSWQKPIRDNILYAIKHAISDNDYAQDINIIQQKFECCGISVQGAEPNLVWLHYLLPDITFQENLYDNMHSLPWSCCRSDYQFMYCDQFAYGRFIVPFNETFLAEYPDCVSLSDCKQKRERALNSVYKQDCAQAFYQAFKIGFFT
ncbi:hypothetical protein DINM_004679 [Dirofilaria immitis]|nr:hypothetical protein [Dirofilaria immitis]